MKTLIIVAAILSSGVPSDALAQDAASIEDLSWLSGCWESVGGEAGSGEYWTVPAGKTMFSVSRTVRNSETIAHEFVQIRQTETGEIEFIANPSGQEGAAFKMIRLSETEVVFENLDHDFPQRIMYSLKEGGRLDGRIEGVIGGAERAADFPLNRIECGS